MKAWELIEDRIDYFATVAQERGVDLHESELQDAHEACKSEDSDGLVDCENVFDELVGWLYSRIDLHEYDFDFRYEDGEYALLPEIAEILGCD